MLHRTSPRLLTAASKDTGLPLEPKSVTEFMLAHNVNSAAEVDAVMAQAVAAGAVIVKSAGRAFWGGYTGVLMDLDRHLWEIAWNPAWTFDDSPE